jgi:threonyl-tRNA synthetase
MDVLAKKVFRHSSAHVLGEAAEKRFGCYLCNGPPTTDPPGFYYDMANMDRYVSDGHQPRLRQGLEKLTAGNNSGIQDSEKSILEKLAKSIIKEKQPFQRLVMSKANLIRMFEYSPYKLYFIEKRVPDGGSSTVYRCGPLIDLCRGPHVQDTGRIKAFSILRVRSPPHLFTACY